MKKITKFLISFAILVIFIMPNISLAAPCVDKPTAKPPLFCNYEAAKAAAANIPDCAPDATDRSKCCWQYTEVAAGGQRPGLVQCGRKIKCEYQIEKIEKVEENEKKEKISVAYYKINDGIIARTADPADACNFNELMHLINNIVFFILFALAIPIAGIMFAYAGFTLITAGGDNSSARTKAKEIFFNAAIGLVLAFTAYLIVVFILKTLGYNGSWIFNIW